jgi:hypothetical protein
MLTTKLVLFSPVLFSHEEPTIYIVGSFIANPAMVSLKATGDELRSPRSNKARI